MTSWPRYGIHGRPGFVSERASALRAEDRGVRQAQHELAADETFEARTAAERTELLVERAVERDEGSHQCPVR
jgi:hypothetical protein